MIIYLKDKDFNELCWSCGEKTQYKRIPRSIWKEYIICMAMELRMIIPQDIKQFAICEKCWRSDDTSEVLTEKAMKRTGWEKCS